MAFPSVPASGTTCLFTTAVGAAATRTFPNLSSLTKSSGDLLIAVIIAYQSASPATSGNVFSAWGGGFTEFADKMTTPGSTMAIGAAYKWSTGSETGTFTVTQAATITGDAVMFLMAIPGAHATTPPEATAIADGTAAGADPAALTPSWGADDTLWIAVGGCGETSASGSWTGMASAPTSYTGYIDSAVADLSTIGQVDAAVAFRQLNAVSENVGAFTCDFSNARNSALVIAVRPVPHTDVAITTTVLSGSVSFPAAAFQADESLTTSALATSASFPAVTTTTLPNFNDFEEGSNTTVITPANSGGAGETAFSSVTGSPAFSSAWAAHGTLSALMNVNGQVLHWNTGSQPDLYFRAYWKLGGRPGTAVVNCIKVVGASGSADALRIQATGNGLVLPDTTSFTNTAENGPYRFEGHVTSAGAWEVKLFAPGNIDGTVADETKSGTGLTVGAITGFEMWCAGAGTPSWYFDDAAISPAGYIGPVVVPDASVTTSVLAASASFPAPAVQAGSGASPGVLSGSVSFPAPTVNTGQDASVTATLLAGSVSFPAATPGAGSVVTTSALAGSASFPAATVNAGSGITTSVLTTSVSFPAPLIRADASLTTAVLSVSASFPAPTVSTPAGASVELEAQWTRTPVSGASWSTAGSIENAVVAVEFVYVNDAQVIPDTLATAPAFPAPSVSVGVDASVTTTTLAAPASFPAPAVSTGSVVTTTALSGSVSFPAATVNEGSGVTTSVLATSVSFPAPAIRADQTLTTTALAGSASFPAAALRTDETLTTAVLAGTVSFGFGLIASPPTLSTAVSFPAPAINAGSVTTPSALSTTTSFPAATVNVSRTAAPAVLSGSVSFPAATIAAGSGVTPAALAASASFPAPSIRADAALATTALDGSASFPTPTITAGGNITIFPVTFTGTVSFPAPAVSSSSLLTAATLAGTVSFPAATARAGSGVTPATLAGPASFPAPAIRTDQALVTPALAPAIAFPAPVVRAGATVTPPALVIACSFPVPSLRADASLTPAALARAASFPAPSVTAGASAAVTPAALAGTVAFPAPVVQVNATAAPATLAGPASFAAPQVRSGAVVTPAVLAVAAAFPAAQASAGAAVVPAALVTPVTFTVPEIIHALPVFGAMIMSASGSMAVHAAAGPDLETLWRAYQDALAVVLASNQDLIEAVIAGGRSGLTGTKYSQTYRADAELERTYAAWQAASRKWQRETSVFAAYGSAAAT